MKKAAFGTRLRYSEPGDNSLHVIHYVADISGPEVSVESVDVTTHDSRDAFEESLAGLASGGDVSFDLIFDSGPGGHSRILELVDAREVINFDLLMPRADVEFVTNGGFASGSGWTTDGGWGIAGGKASISVADAANDDLTQDLTGLIIGERYLLKVLFSAEGTGAITLSFAGLDIATFTPSEGEAAFNFRAPATSGTLYLTGPESGAFAADIDSVSLTGINEDANERFDFVGIFTKAGILAPVKDALKASVSIKVTGRPSYAVAS